MTMCDKHGFYDRITNKPCIECLKELGEEINCDTCMYRGKDCFSVVGKCENYNKWESIPYKEEPEKKCETCGHQRVKDTFCKLWERCVDFNRWIPKEEKPEPKTKRVGVIWFGEVEGDPENPMLIDEMTGKVIDQVELIDLNRLRYGVPEESDVFVHDNVGIRTADKCGYDLIRLIIDPPTPEPEPETVEDVLKRMPLVSEHRKAFLNGDDNAIMSKYISRLEAWQKDLKAAQEWRTSDE